MKEKDLIAGCIRGDRNAQSTLFDLYHDKMFLICMENCKNEKEAKEALIDALVSVYDDIKYYKGDSLEEWIKGKVLNKCKMNKRWKEIILCISIIVIVVALIAVNALR